MRQQTTPAIILRRTNYGEADRIVSFLTPLGKISAIVKGVRRAKSKLAGGIELFSVSTITFMETKGNLARIISTRLEEHYSDIVGDLQRMMVGYEMMKLMDKIIEDEAERDYFDLLKAGLSSLNSSGLPLLIVESWFNLRLLKLQGHEPNLKTDSTNQKLQADKLYEFNIDDMCFQAVTTGSFRAEHIKLMRLMLSEPLGVIGQINGVEELAGPLKVLTRRLVEQYIN